MASDEYVLGIDVGSSSIKAMLIRRSDFVHVAEQRVDSTLTYVVNDNIHSEQNMALLIEYVDRSVQALPAALLKQVVAIGICGQMHGVVCWSSAEHPWSMKKSPPQRPDKYDDNDSMFVDETKVSHHYTWQDNRCTPHFLASLPSSQSHLSVHTGYGCATLFWLSANNPDMLKKFDRAATIADFTVAMLCDLDIPQTSPQNAASWGYFDTQNCRFEENVLREANFPIHMLPCVRPDNGVAGTLKRPWHGIPPGIIVGVALGDLQAYVLAILQNEKEAIVNISTSAQMVFIDHAFKPSKAEKTAAKVVPYFNGKYLYEGAALNGGNAISLFVDFVFKSTTLFGCNITKVLINKNDLFPMKTKNEIWLRLIEDSLRWKTENDLTQPPPRFIPTFWGERHCPLQRASICHLTSDNLNLASLFQALCKGVVDNIHELVPLAVLHQRGIERIVGTGSTLLRNETLRRELENRYAPLPIHFQQSGSADSAVGAALAILQHL